MNRKFLYSLFSLLALVFSFTFIIATAHGSNGNLYPNRIVLPGFPVRSVVIMPAIQTYEKESIDGDYIRYFENQLLGVYKIPYYNATIGFMNYISTSPQLVESAKNIDASESTKSSKDTEWISHDVPPVRQAIKPVPSRDYLQALARNFKTDIVILPVIDRWTYREVRPMFGVTKRLFNPFNDDYDDDREPYYETYLHLSVYSYNSKTDTFTRTDIKRSFNGESYEVPRPMDMWKEAIDALVAKLPYKRIPTDVPHYTDPSDPGNRVIRPIRPIVEVPRRPIITPIDPIKYIMHKPAQKETK